MSNFELLFHQNADGSFSPYMGGGNSGCGKAEFPKMQEYPVGGGTCALLTNAAYQMQNLPLSQPIWCSGLIQSDGYISETESVKKTAQKEETMERFEESAKEKDPVYYTTDEICQFYLLALTDALRCKLVRIAAEKEQLAENADAFYGAKSQGFLVLYPQKTFEFLADFMSETRPELLIPTIRDFEEFLWKTQILQKEDGDKNRFRKKVRIGEKRPRLWVINQKELMKRSKEVEV